MLEAFNTAGFANIQEGLYQGYQTMGRPFFYAGSPSQLSSFGTSLPAAYAAQAVLGLSFAAFNLIRYGLALQEDKQAKEHQIPRSHSLLCKGLRVLTEWPLTYASAVLCYNRFKLIDPLIAPFILKTITFISMVSLARLALDLSGLRQKHARIERAYRILDKTCLIAPSAYLLLTSFAIMRYNKVSTLIKIFLIITQLHQTGTHLTAITLLCVEPWPKSTPSTTYAPLISDKAKAQPILLLTAGPHNP
jgi:hypothetical protein